MDNKYDHIYYVTAKGGWTLVNKNSYRMMIPDESICLGSIGNKVLIITICLHNLKE